LSFSKPTKYNKVGIFGKKLTYHLATLVSEIDPQPTWSQSYEICTLQRQRQRCSRLERLLIGEKKIILKARRAINSVVKFYNAGVVTRDRRIVY
jgi:hypothetical protein